MSGGISKLPLGAFGSRGEPLELLLELLELELLELELLLELLELELLLELLELELLLELLGASDPEPQPAKAIAAVNRIPQYVLILIFIYPLFIFTRIIFRYGI